MDEQHARGLALRKQVMGEDFVERAYDNADEFALAFQDLVSRNAWGAVWDRGILDLRTRSLLTLGMLIALGRTHEIKGHVRGALNNGASRADIREVLFHSTVYCGFPLAVDAYRSIREVFDSLPPAEAEAAADPAA
ncbi:MAG: carboxymuconolactone decarboxylase family protein [Pseudomonadota bacterium]|nr:carboxymuconolactone decarboxylase family protein [Pseudomonadota bacterium]